MKTYNLPVLYVIISLRSLMWNGILLLHQTTSSYDISEVQLPAPFVQARALS